jgi:hypothetical protein
MLKKYLPLIVFFSLLIGIFWSALFSPSLTLYFVVAAILCSLGISTSLILEKHKGAENARQKITRDILILLVIFTLVILIGGGIGFWAAKQAEGRFGAVVAVISALAVSFAAGYLVRKGMGKFLA